MRLTFLIWSSCVLSIVEPPHTHVVVVVVVVVRPLSGPPPQRGSCMPEGPRSWTVAPGGPLHTPGGNLCPSDTIIGASPGPARYPGTNPWFTYENQRNRKQLISLVHLRFSKPESHGVWRCSLSTPHGPQPVDS